MDNDNVKKLHDFIEKVDSMKKQEKMDLSSDQDLSIAVMNLISIEEHFFFTGAKLGKEKYYDLIGDVREMRKELLKKLVKHPEGEVWCISKHLLAASMRLMEVGTKQQSMGNKEEAYNLFEKAFNLYSLFWGLNMKLIDVGEVKEIDDDMLHSKDDKKIKDEPSAYQHPSNQSSTEGSLPAKKGIMGKLGHIVKRAIDCCIE